jgi:superfamily II DNA/RNA helicase
LTRELER